MKLANLWEMIKSKKVTMENVKLTRQLFKSSIIFLLLLPQLECAKAFENSVKDDHSVILALIAYSLVTAQQGPCGKYVTINSTTQNLNFVSYVNSGVSFSGAIVYLPNVKTNNKLMLCSNSNVNFYQTANFVMRMDNNCAPGITNTPKVSNVLGANVLVGNCYSYPIQIDGSYTLSVFIEGNSFPNDAQVYLQ
ncbi:hypothetical protein [Leptospira santarosai]|uniref:Uncharacterized protein n=1 Tax=Leptospira santarosai TaxID=28183 RepID=A0AB73N0Q5_9LEPT|nr:hypothetical protein [Leptospira santarosai]MDI7219456.1 hypothetical protein [Leptospira santarosai]ONF92323.1 hypothetical protein BWD14_14020 [Leptospira santarosai]